MLLAGLHSRRFEQPVLSSLFGGDLLLPLPCGIDKWKGNIWSYCLGLCCEWRHPVSLILWSCNQEKLFELIPALSLPVHFGCLSKRNEAMQRGFFLIIGEDIWAPGPLSCGVHGRATPAPLCGHGLWEQVRFTGEGVWEGEQKAGDAKAS